MIESVDFLIILGIIFSTAALLAITFPKKHGIQLLLGIVVFGIVIKIFIWWSGESVEAGWHFLGYLRMFPVWVVFWGVSAVLTNLLFDRWRQ